MPVPAQEAPEWFVESFLDIREDAAEAARDGRRLMLYFMQAGCPYCRRLVTVNWREPQIVEKTRRHFVSLATNIWGAYRIEGYLPPREFSTALDTACRAAATRASLPSSVSSCGTRLSR